MGGLDTARQRHRRTSTLTQLRRGEWSGAVYFGPNGFALLVGDFNKTPWSVDPRYLGRLVVRGRQLDGGAIVTFGFWPRQYGTSAERLDVSAHFRRADQERRTVVYQPEKPRQELGVKRHSLPIHWPWHLTGFRPTAPGLARAAGHRTRLG